MPIRNHFSRLLGERRLNIREVARRTGLSYGALFALYHDRSGGITFDTLDALCRELKIQVSDLLEYVPEDQP